MKMMLPDIIGHNEPITTLSASSMFMSIFIRTDYHAGQIFIPHRHQFETTMPVHSWCSEIPRK